jgi:hypothetical protein
MYGYGYGWGTGQVPAPASVATPAPLPPPPPPAWMASQAAIAQHARYMLQEAIAWLIGAGVAQRTIHQDVDRLTTQLQETDPPFRTRIGEWFFDGTHWTLRPKTVFAAAGWAPRAMAGTSYGTGQLVGSFCGDAMGNRWCAQPYPQTLGDRCGCYGYGRGYGYVVP